MTDRELLEQWLRPGAIVPVTMEATRILVEALRARLSQCERCGEINPAEIHTCSPQEPVIGTKTWFQDGKMITQDLHPSDVYLDPPQREWQGLTDEDVAEVERWVDFKEEGSGRIPTEKLVRYIEAKLKEKNT